MTGGFKGKTALIVGGGSGLGAAVARTLVSRGAEVVIMGRRAGIVAATVEHLGGAAHAWCGDASVADDVDGAIALAESLGGLNVLVCCAGGGGMGSVTDLDDASWSQAFNATLNTAFVSARQALPALKRQRGNIVLVSSLAGLFAGPRAAGYVASKHALIGLTRSLARDYGPHGVRANVVCPGWIRTEKGDAIMSVVARQKELRSATEAYEMVTRDVPLRRAAYPEEVAKVICFLASDDAAIVSGAVLTADGGASAVDVPSIALSAGRLDGSMARDSSAYIQI